MPLIEVDETELAQLKGHKALLDRLGANPKTRTQILGLVKEAMPNLVIPEIDAAKPLRDDVAALKKELADERAARAKEKEEEARAAQAAEIDKAIAKGRKYLKGRGYAKETVEQIEKMMMDSGQTDYRAAALLWEEDHPDGEPVSPTQNFGTSSDLMNPPEDNPWAKAIEAGHKGGRRAADSALKRVQNSQVNDFLREIRGQQRARG